MGSTPAIPTTQLQDPSPETIEAMITIYRDGLVHDPTTHLTHINPPYLDLLASLLTTRIRSPSFLFLLAHNPSTQHPTGWLSLALQHTHKQTLSETHLLQTQYLLLPDLATKAQKRGIPLKQLTDLAQSTLQAFKTERETHLPEKHSLLTALVVAPGEQNTGVASALLTHAIRLTEVFVYPIWVPAPSGCAGLFAKYGFEEVGGHVVDLEALIPTEEGKGKDKGKGKGKADDAPVELGRREWKFMLRSEPLQPALRVYSASKVCAERAAALRTQEGDGEGGKEREAPGVKNGEALLGEGLARVTLDGNDDEEEEDAGEGSSAPLLGKGEGEGKVARGEMFS